MESLGRSKRQPAEEMNLKRRELLKAAGAGVILAASPKIAVESTEISPALLAKELSESGEIFPFPGMVQKLYESKRAFDAEFPGLSTPTDTIIGRCRQEGIKVVLGENPESGNVFILPAGGGNIVDDSLSPKDLLAENVTDLRLKNLITKYI